MKTPTVEEELRTKHQVEEKEDELIGTLDELKNRGHVAEETIEEVSRDSLLPVAVGFAVALGGAVLVGDALHAMRRGAVRMRRRAKMRRLRHKVRHVFG